MTDDGAGSQQCSPDDLSSQAPADAGSQQSTGGAGLQQKIIKVADIKPRNLSGKKWVAKFPTSKDISDLESTFQANVNGFINAIKEKNEDGTPINSGVNVDILATYRPPERAFLMHWSWCIVKEHYDANKVPKMDGVDICWWHGDQTKSEEAAQEMVDGYTINKLKVAPALNSRHTSHQAIDMSITWSGDLNIKNYDGTPIKITKAPRNSTNPDLIKIGKTYGVIHFLTPENDVNHWSTDGH